VEEVAPPATVPIFSPRLHVHTPSSPMQNTLCTSNLDPSRARMETVHLVHPRERTRELNSRAVLVRGMRASVICVYADDALSSRAVG